MPARRSVQSRMLFRGSPRNGILRVRCRRGARSALLLLALGPVLGGCIIGTERPALNLEVPEAYRAAPKGDADAAVPAVDWWRGFRSAELTALMDAAQLHNLDIAVAVAQIVQADAQVGVSGAPLLPTVTGDASAERQKQSRANTSLGSGNGFGGTTFNTLDRK